MGQTKTKLIKYDELPDPGSKGLIVKINSAEIRLFLVKNNDQIYIYKNSCPHTLGPLDWLPDSFLSEDKKYIMCANHGALFQIDDGMCVYGPCKNQKLQKLSYTINNGSIYLLT